MPISDFPGRPRPPWPASPPPHRAVAHSTEALAVPCGRTLAPHPPAPPSESSRNSSGVTSSPRYSKKGRRKGRGYPNSPERVRLAVTADQGSGLSGAPRPLGDGTSQAGRGRVGSHEEPCLVAAWPAAGAGDAGVRA